MFKKEDIKPGMLVEVKFDYNGSKSLMYVTECTNGIVFIDKDDCYSMLKTYNDNLEETCSKIMKVYGFSEYECKSRSISTEDRELLWDRGDEVDWSKVEVDTKVLVRNPNIRRMNNMIQVKEFDCSIEDEMNKWLKENDKNIIVKDIKYQTAINENSIYTSALIIYEKIK